MTRGLRFFAALCLGLCINAIADDGADGVFGERRQQHCQGGHDAHSPRRKQVGKQELYVPYNSYKLSGNQLKLADVLKPGHINPDHARYELHRVWVVEATLKEGTSHIYRKRTFYIDEDSWMIMVTDKYDARGEMWRVSEQHSINFYDVPMAYGTIEVHHDLQSGRYLAMGLRNEEPKVYEKIKRSAADFTPAGLRGIGTR